MIDIFKTVDELNETKNIEENFNLRCCLAYRLQDSFYLCIYTFCSFICINKHNKDTKSILFFFTFNLMINLSSDPCNKGIEKDAKVYILTFEAIPK